MIPKGLFASLMFPFISSNKANNAAADAVFIVCFVIPKGFMPLSVAQIHYVGLSQKASTFGGHFFLFKNLIEASFRGP